VITDQSGSPMDGAGLLVGTFVQSEVSKGRKKREVAKRHAFDPGSHLKMYLEITLAFLNRQSAQARYTMSRC